MSSDKQQGFVLYFDALNALNKQVAEKQISADDAFSVVAALGQFAQSGEEPAVGSLSPVASMAYALMVGGVKKSLEKYAEKKQKTRDAANARWGNASQPVQTDADATPSVHEDADACERMQTEGIETEYETEQTSSSGRNVGEDDGQVSDPVASVDPVQFSHDMDALESQWRRMGCTPTDTTYEWFESLMAEHSVDEILKAMAAADENGAKNPRKYISAILRNWKNGSDGRDGARAAPVFESKGGKDYYDGFEVYG